MNINQKHVRMHEAHMNTLYTQRSVWPSQPTIPAMYGSLPCCTKGGKNDVSNPAQRGKE